MKKIVLYTLFAGISSFTVAQESPAVKQSKETMIRNLTKDYAQLGDCVETFLTIIRDRTSSCRDFRKATKNLAVLLANETQAYLPVEWVAIETPCGKTTGIRLTNKIVLIPALRSGLSLLPAFLEQFEDARIGFIGLKNTLDTSDCEQYYVNMPPITPQDRIIVLLPIIATGNKACTAIETVLNNTNTQEQQIIVVGIVGATAGLNNVRLQFPDVTLIIAAQDDDINENHEIIPGVGKFGNRYFMTE